MKRALFFTLLLAAGYVLLNSQRIIAAFSASNSTLPNNGQEGPSQQDRALAAAIRRLANTSNEGLVEQKMPDGGVMIDLQGRFQHLPLAKMNPDGEIAVGCVSRLEEANAFFGRNLETGEIYPPMAPRDEATTQAAQLGMSRQEFLFYRNLIADAVRRRQFNPNAATITITNNDGAGEGFNDPAARAPVGGNTGTTLGQQRLNLFTFAGNIWGAFLDSTVTTNVTAQFNPLTPCSTDGGVLGSAGATTIHGNFTNAEFTNTFYHVALANKQSGGDRNAATAEINTTFNSDVDNACLGAGTGFYYGLDNNPSAGTTNLLIVALHELGHGLGFSTFTNASTGAFTGGLPNIYSRFMFDRSVNLFWHEMTDAQRATSAVNTGNVLWDGASVRIASGALTAGRDAATGRVQLFTPNPVQGGSSLSHWDTAAFPNLLMEPAINSGLPSDLDLTRQQMRDIGWFVDTTGDVVADTITSVQPNSGVLTIGSMVNITWTNTGGFGRNVTIELSLDGGATFPTTIASDVANTGTQSFTVPNTPTTQAVIRVREHNFAAPSGVSSATFTIANVLTWNGSADSNWDNGNNWNTLTAPVTADAVIIPASGVTNNPTISASDVTVANLVLGSGRIITANSGRTLTISGCTTSAFTGGDATSYVNGSLQRCVNTSGAFSFPVGTASAYSPVSVTGTTGSTNLTVMPNVGRVTGTTTATAINRFWALSSTAAAGVFVGNLSFTFVTPADTADYIGPLPINRVIRRTSGGILTNFAGSTVGNTVTVTGINAFSDWGLGGDTAAPTLAEVKEYEGYRFDDGNLIRWHSSFETHNLGFNVYRQEGKRRVPITPDLVAGSALRFGTATLTAGSSYSWWDRNGSPDSTYWVEDVDLNGTRKLHGPIPLTPAGPDSPLAHTPLSALLSQLRPASESHATHIQQVLAPAAALPAAGSDAWQQQLTLAGRNAVQLTLRQTGWYRVRGDQLPRGGIAPDADVRFLQLFLNGQQQPLAAKSQEGREAGALGDTGYIEFYGTGADTRETDSNTYWLVTGERPGLRFGAPGRIAPGGGDVEGGSPQPAGAGGKNRPLLTAPVPGSAVSFPYTVEREDNTIYFAAIRNGEENENFFGPIVNDTALNQTLPVQKLASASAGTLEVALQGASQTPHRVAVKLNGQALGTVTYQNQTRGVQRLNVPAGVLAEGDNTVTVQAVGSNDVSVVDYLRLTYQHRYEAENNRLGFHGGPAGLKVSGFTGHQVRVFDVTEPERLFEVAARVTNEAGGYAVTLPNKTQGRVLYAVEAGQMLVPAQMAANAPSSWTQATRRADFLIVTHSAFRSAVEPLANLRRGQGVETEVINVEDLYEEWGGGGKNVNAIRGFLLWAKANWQLAPRYVLVVGDATLDPRNYLGWGENDFLPTGYVETIYLETASDESLADSNGDGIGEMAFGRLPARTLAQAQAMVNKVLNYEPAADSRGALLVSDRPEGYDFEAMSQALRELLPAGMPAVMVNRAGVTDAEARSQILAGMNGGPALVNYSGHGSIEVWTSFGLLRSTDAGGLTNSGRLPVVYTMTCLNGYFQDVGSESLAEALVKAPQGGAVAVWSSSGLTVATGQAQVNRALMRYIYQESSGPRLGDAVRAAKGATGDLEVRKTWILFGDPTLLLR